MWPWLRAWTSGAKVTSKHLLKEPKRQCCTLRTALHFGSFIKSQAGSSGILTNYE